MTSVTLSHTSTRSKSTKHAKTRSEQWPRTSDGIEKLAVKTASLLSEPGMKMRSPRPEFPAETLSVMLGDRTRRSRCPPEFLLEMSARDPSKFYEEHGKKLKIITGPEAVTFYKKFLGGRGTADILAEEDLVGVATCAVFAVAVEDGGRNYADYYTTWPKTESARDAAEAKRLKHLHSQFRKTARALDRDFKRASIYGVAGPAMPEQRVEEVQQPSIAEEQVTAKAHPSNIVVPPADMKVDGKILSPVSATDSVMSLPYLNFIRNVPNGHRIPLRVTNPDNRLSMMSSISPVASPTTPVKATQQPINTSSVGNKFNYFPAPAPTPFSTPAPAEKSLIPEGVPRSDSSIRTSRSKASTRSSVTTSTVSKDSHQGSHKVKEIPEFLMVLLDGRITQEPRTWHGLERQNSRSTPRSTSRISLWDGPLARETGHSFAHPARPDGEESSEEEEEEEEEDYDNSPIVPPLPPLFGVARSVSEPRYFHPIVPATIQGYRLPVSHGGSPIGSFANLAYGPSPLPPAPVLYPPSPYAGVTYVSPYQSPAVPPMRPLSQSTPFQQQ